MSDEIEDELVSRTAELINEDKNKEALKTADTLEHYKNEDAIVLYTKGIALYENRKFNEALRYLSEAATINRTEKRIWYAIGYTLLALNRIDEARDALKYVISVDDSHVGAHLGLFLIGIIKENQDVAFYHLQKALEIDKKLAKEILKNMYKEFIESADIDNDIKKIIYEKFSKI